MSASASPSDSSLSAERGSPFVAALPPLWFYFFNLSVVIFGVPYLTDGRGMKPEPWAGAILGLTLQAALLAIWLGGGGSPLWKRGLVLAGSFFYFGYYLRKQATPPSMLAACPIGIGIITAVIAVVAIRAIFCYLAGTKAYRQNSLKDLFSGTAAVAFSLAIWSGPLRVYFLQYYKFGTAKFVPQLAWNCLTFGMLVFSVALPLLFRRPQSRRRAMVASAMLFLVYFVATSTRQIQTPLDLLPAVIPAAIMLAFYWSIFFSAEIAFQQWGVDLIRPVDVASEAR